VSTPAQTGDQPLITLVIDDRDDEDVTISMTTRGLSLREAREYLGQALLNLDQKIWAEKHGGRVSNLPASSF